MARVTVVVPTLNRRAAAAALVRSLSAQTFRGLEVLVVDQSDERGLERDVRGAARYVHIGEKGLPNARNVAAREALGEVVLYLDDDMVVPADLVAKHERHYADPRVAAVGGRIVGRYDRPTSDGRVGRLRRWDMKLIRNFSSDRPAAPHHLPGGNVSVRRALVERVGGFDRAFGGTSVGEETDFFLRLRALGNGEGFRYVFDPEACVEHVPVTSGGCREPDPRPWTYWMMHNATLLALRHAPWWSIPGFVLGRVARAALLEAGAARSGVMTRGLTGLLRGASSFLKTGGVRYA